MTSNKPFNSECRNIFTEVVHNVIPSAFGMNNVTAMQTQQHSVCDTVSTSIVGNSQQPLACNHSYTNTQAQIPLYYTNVYYNGLQNTQVIQAQKRWIPGGVTFSFEPIYHNPNNNYPNYVYQGHGIPTHSNIPPHNQGVYYNQRLIQQQIELKQIEKKALELMLIQEHLNKSMGKFKFHHHGQTSTTDLSGGESQITKSREMPDFNNLMAVLNDLKRELKEMEAVDFSCDCPSALYSQVSTAKKLMLTKSPDLVEKEQRKKEILPEVSDHTDSQVESQQAQNTETPKPETETDKSIQSKKKVCFKGFQGRTKKRKPRKSKKKRSRRRRSHTESSSVSSKSSPSDSSEDSDSYQSSD